MIYTVHARCEQRKKTEGSVQKYPGTNGCNAFPRNFPVFLYRLHNILLNNIMRTPMSFFDTTPLGRIVNRFSKDMDVIDENLQRALTDFLWCFFDVIGMIVAISYATPLFLTILPPLAVLYIYIQVRIQATTSSHCGVKVLRV